MNRFDILTERPVPAELPPDHLEKTKFDDHAEVLDYFYRHIEPIQYINCTFTLKPFLEGLPKIEKRTRFEILRDVD